MRTYTGIGSRETPEETLQLMQKTAYILGQLGYRLRTGGAPGADTAFELGAVSVPNGPQPEVYLPWRGFNNRTSQFYNVSTQALALAEKYHPAWERLAQGPRKLMGRNCYQVLGASLDNPSDFILCWTKDGKASGGTGQAIRIAQDYQIPVFNMKNPNVFEEVRSFLRNTPS